MRKLDPEGTVRLQTAQRMGELIQAVAKLWGINGQLPLTVDDALKNPNRTLATVLAFEITQMGLHGHEEWDNNLKRNVWRPQTLDERLAMIEKALKVQART